MYRRDARKHHDDRTVNRLSSHLLEQASAHVAKDDDLVGLSVVVIVSNSQLPLELCGMKEADEQRAWKQEAKHERTEKT